MGARVSATKVQMYIAQLTYALVRNRSDLSVEWSVYNHSLVADVRKFDKEMRVKKFAICETFFELGAIKESAIAEKAERWARRAILALDG